MQQSAKGTHLPVINRNTKMIRSKFQYDGVEEMNEVDGVDEKNAVNCWSVVVKSNKMQ